MPFQHSIKCWDINFTFPPPPPPVVSAATAYAAVVFSALHTLAPKALISFCQATSWRERERERELGKQRGKRGTKRKERARRI